MIRHVLEFKNIFVGYSNRMEEETNETTMPTVKMSRNQRYHALHRESRCEKRKEVYHNRPDVIAKKEERERKKAEKEAQQKAEKEAKEANKQKTHQKVLEIALATMKKPKNTSGNLTKFLGGDTSGERDKL